MSEIPVHSRPRRLADWINPTGARKVHSLDRYAKRNEDFVPVTAYSFRRL